MQDDALENEKKYGREKKVLEEHISMVQDRLKDAQNDVDRARAHVERMRDAKPVVEPSAIKEIERVKRIIRIAPPAPRS